MKKLIFTYFILFLVKTACAETNVVYKTIDGKYSWNQVVSLQNAQIYRFNGVGLGIEHDVLTYDNLHIKTNGHFIAANYFNIAGGGISFFPMFTLVDDLKLGPEVSLGFEFLKTKIEAPHQASQLSMYSDIGPRLEYKRLTVGVYLYFSSSTSISLSGVSTKAMYTVSEF